MFEKGVFVVFRLLRFVLNCFFAVCVCVFPEARFVAGFFRRLLAYTLPCKSISIIPHISFQYVSLQYVLIQSVFIQYLSIQCITIQYVSNSHVSIQCVSIQYVSSSHVSIQYVSFQYVCSSRNGNDCEYKTFKLFTLTTRTIFW